MNRTHDRSRSHRRARDRARAPGLRRRAFLRGAGGVIVGLPFLERFAAREAAAGPDDAPIRYLQFLHPQGTVWNQWAPTGGETDFALTPVLDPLQALVDELVFIRGVNNESMWLNQLSNGHNAAGRTLLTAMPFSGNLDGQGNLLPEAQQIDNGHAAGPSIDQVIAQHLQAPTPYSSLNFGVGGPHVGEYQMLFAGADEPVSLDGHPQEVFDKLFSNNDPMTPTTLEMIRAQRKSVLDSTLEGFTRLQGQVGAADRQRLEAHADKIREIEQSLENTGNPGVGCATPSVTLPPGYTPDTDGGLFDDSSSRVFIDLMVMAMACDLSRVGTLQFTNYHAPTYPWLGHAIPGGYDSWHTWVHAVEDPAGDATVLDVFRWYMGELAYFLQQLRDTPEGDSTLLDHSLVLATSEFDNGSVHSAYSLPIILAGNLCGRLETGRSLDRGGHYHGELFAALQQLYGVESESFGWAPLCEGPISLG